MSIADNDMTNESLERLQLVIDYHFAEIELLREALTHKSYANEMQMDNMFGNERFEFLGDAVLELIIRHILMERFPGYSEGYLSKLRSAVVNAQELARLALRFDMGSFVLLSRGEEDSGGREKISILANVYEAILAAVYYDGGYQKAFAFVEKHFADLIDEVSQNGYQRDYKSRLQEYCQSVFHETPTYELVKEQGPDHIKEFETQVVIAGRMYEKGRGGNKKLAEQEAAKKTLQRLIGK